MDALKEMEFCRRSEDTSYSGKMPHSHLRKTKKPLIEKKRRDRINTSLSNLKALLLDNIRRNGGTQISKLDKADILEMTVNHLRMSRFGQSSGVAISTKVQYSNGYQECAKEAVRYLSDGCGLSNSDVTSRVGKHLFQSQPINDGSAFLEPSKEENRRAPTKIFEPIKIRIPQISFSTPKQSFKHINTFSTLPMPVYKVSNDIYMNHSVISPLGGDDQVNSPASDSSVVSNSGHSMDPSKSYLPISSEEESFASEPSTWRPW